MSLQAEKEKLRNMSVKDKAWYLFTYYKFHAAAVLLVFIIALLIFQTVRRNSMDVYLNAIIINNRLLDNEEREIKNQFSEYVSLNPDKERISLSTDFSMDIQNPSADAFSYMAKISVFVAGNQLDVMIADTDVIDHYAAMTGFHDLSQVLPADLLTRLEDNFYYAEDEAGNRAPYGVIIDNSSLSPYIRSLDPAVLGLVSNSESLDHGISFLRFLFE